MERNFNLNLKKNNFFKLCFISIIIIFLIILIIVGNLKKNNEEKDDKFRILTSFYPLYIMVQNITNDANNVEVSNMAEKFTGCIHDYTISTTDLKKFEKANVFIENGRNLENFTEKIISIYPKVEIIESSENISNFIEEDDEINPHVWLSIENYIMQIRTITEKLEKMNPENMEVYSKNSNDYIEKLEELKPDYEVINNIKDKKAICLNESLEYLLKDASIEVTSIETDHEQSVLSAKVLGNIIDKMKRENIKVIFIDKDDDTKTAKILENETGARVYVLNSEMNGNGSKDDYINIMKENIEILKNIKYL